MVYASHNSTSPSNTGSPSSTPSSSSSGGPSGSTSSGSGNGGSGLGSTGSASSDTSSGVVSGGSSNNLTPSTQGGSTAHCDRPGYPSCSSLGSEAGKNAAGSSCPTGHSKAFCSAYNAAAGPSATISMPRSSTQKGNITRSSVGNTTTSFNSTSSHQTDAAHCDQAGYPSCYSIGFKDGKSNPGTRCPSRHSVNFCAGWNAAAGNPATKTIPAFAKVTEIAPGAAPGPHTLEYIQAFNIAAGNPYKPGTKQYDDYQAGLDDATKAGRDCDKMDTCGGPDLLGNYVNGVLHLDNKQYCGNGFGVYSSTLCSFQKDCSANIIGIVACPKLPTTTPSGSSGNEGGRTTTTVKYIGGIPGLGVVQTATASSDRIIMLPSNASDFANNDPKTLTLDFVNPTGPDPIGNYYVKGEVVNNGNTTLQSLKITAHWYDSMHRLIGVTFGYRDNVLQPLDSGKRTTFTILADGHTDLLGKPKFVELSYDWH